MATINVEEYVEKYGPDLGETFFHVHVQWCQLFNVFSQYANLFGKPKERVDLLNEIAGPFFNTVQDTFHDQILLGICRLTDPAQSMKKVNPNRNVSVLRLALLLKDEDVGPEIEDMANSAKVAADFARIQRDKKISHSDFDVATGRSIIPSGASIVQMRKAIKAIYEVIFAVGKFVGNEHLASFVVLSRSEFGLLASLFDAQYGKEEVFLKKVEQMRKDHSFKFHPDWLLNEDEATNWR